MRTINFRSAYKNDFNPLYDNHSVFREMPLALNLFMAKWRKTTGQDGEWVCRFNSVDNYGSGVYQLPADYRYKPSKSFSSPMMLKLK